jgi:hypothetical protein
VSESDSKELGAKASKKKKISKQPRNEYIKFFKFYYERLTVEHPRWSANQITTIIKLLWKKKLTQEKGRSKDSLRTPRQIRLSGRMAFKKTYTYSSLEAYLRWKQLPKESKGYWKIRGLGLSMEKKPTQKTLRLQNNKKSDTSIDRRLSFMSAKMTSVATSGSKVPAPL